ncbi:hypothetical protein SAMN02982927_00523 [Sporolactobacillus nakayamae]|uniref:Uncharacterized protein n=1 Tax=Sporolactobacillus nakayamae TaxID=269670 RepID=A0A1I2NUC9_9BACL|nr:hypothetical protein SAMN02982927_00523 [Sporolactobacillus nakayamae]
MRMSFSFLRSLSFDQWLEQMIVKLKTLDKRIETLDKNIKTLDKLLKSLDKA